MLYYDIYYIYKEFDPCFTAQKNLKQMTYLYIYQMNFNLESCF